MTPAHVIRPMVDSDRGYVIDTWLKSYRGSPMALQLPDWAYWSQFGHVGLVESLLARDDTIVSCLRENEGFIFGWACSSSTQLHYLFVRQEFRRQGHGTSLYDVSGKPTAITHVTPSGSRMLSHLGVQPEFVNPYKEKR